MYRHEQSHHTRCSETQAGDLSLKSQIASLKLIYCLDSRRVSLTSALS